MTAGLDARLALGAAGAWLAMLVCLGASPGALLAVAAGCCGVGLAALAATQRGVRLASTVALVGFCIALVLIPFAGRLARSRASPLSQLARQHVPATVELRVAADPRPLAAKGVAGSPLAAVQGSVSSVRVGGRRMRVGGGVLVLAPAQMWRGVLPGQRVRVAGVLQPALDAGSLSVTLFAQSDPTLVDKPPWWQRAAGSVRSALRRASAGLPDGARGLLPGLVDGDTTDLDPVLAERFRLAGLSHLVAVSGTNCSILVGAVLLTLRRARARPWVAAVAGGVVVVAFVVVARPSPSVLRAAVMGCIALAALAGGRPGPVCRGPGAARVRSDAGDRSRLRDVGARDGRPAGVGAGVGGCAAPAAGARWSRRLHRGRRRGASRHRPGDRGLCGSGQPRRDPGERAGRAGGRRRHDSGLRRGAHRTDLAGWRRRVRPAGGLAVPVAGARRRVLRRAARRHAALARRRVRWVGALGGRGRRRARRPVGRSAPGACGGNRGRRRGADPGPCGGVGLAAGRLAVRGLRRRPGRRACAPGRPARGRRDRCRPRSGRCRSMPARPRHNVHTDIDLHALSPGPRGWHRRHLPRSAGRADCHRPAR